MFRVFGNRIDSIMIQTIDVGLVWYKVGDAIGRPFILKPEQSAGFSSNPYITLAVFINLVCSIAETGALCLQFTVSC